MDFPCWNVPEGVRNADSIILFLFRPVEEKGPGTPSPALLPQSDWDEVSGGGGPHRPGGSGRSLEKTERWLPLPCGSSPGSGTFGHVGMGWGPWGPSSPLTRMGRCV